MWLCPFALSKPLLRCEGIACGRGGRLLFEHFDLVLHQGECIEIQGANGSGKSTLLRIAAGLFTVFSGTVEAGDLAYLGHKSGVNALLTPAENLFMHQRLAGGSTAQALQRVGLRDAQDKLCGELSEGQHRRVALARLLLGPQPLWLLDEPLTALDDAGCGLVRELVTARCDEGGAVLCATHRSLGCPGAVQVRLGDGA